jgi:hemerythrin superfamily protein
MPDVVEIIREQHQQLRAAFGRLLRDDADLSTFDEVRSLLSAHETAEEEVLYPALRDAGFRDVAATRVEEEHSAQRLLVELDHMANDGTDRESFNSHVARLHAMVVAHSTREEEEVLPLVEQTQSPAARESMGEVFAAALDVAPTHPHPHSTDVPMANAVLAVVDRVRDAIRQRSKEASMSSDKDKIMDPEGGHDEEALEEAAERMHARPVGKQPSNDDPSKEHDPEALDEGARRMGAKS